MTVFQQGGRTGAISGLYKESHVQKGCGEWTATVARMTLPCGNVTLHGKYWFWCVCLTFKKMTLGLRRWLIWLITYHECVRTRVQIPSAQENAEWAYGPACNSSTQPGFSEQGGQWSWSSWRALLSTEIGCLREYKQSDQEKHPTSTSCSHMHEYICAQQHINVYPQSYMHMHTTRRHKSKVFF